MTVIVLYTLFIDFIFMTDNNIFIFYYYKCIICIIKNDIYIFEIIKINI